MFSALLAEFKGVFGKEYLLAGLLPAASLAIGWEWFQRGELVQVFAKLTALGTDEAPAELLSAATIVLLLGLAFFAARSFLVGFCQALPGRALRPLRDCLIRYQVGRRLAVEIEGNRLAHCIDVFEWAVKGKFDAPTFVPEYEAVPSEEDMVKLSQAACDTVKSLANCSGWAPVAIPTPEQAEVIAQGLGSLYAFAFEHHANPACQRAIASWQEIGGLRSRSVLQVVWDGINRDFARERMMFDNYPNPAWMQPTALGNRAAALDDYAKDRYGIDTSPLVNRLLGILEDGERQDLSDARLTVAVLVNLAAAMLLLGSAATLANLSMVVSLRLLTSVDFSPRAFLFIVCPGLLSYLFYRAAVFAYATLAEKVMRNVDLHRLELIKQLGYALPKEVREENLLWQELGLFFVQAKELDPDRPIKKSE